MGNSFRIYQDIKLAFGEMDLVGMVRIKFKTRHTYQKQKKKKKCFRQDSLFRLLSSMVIFLEGSGLYQRFFYKFFLNGRWSKHFDDYKRLTFGRKFFRLICITLTLVLSYTR